MIFLSNFNSCKTWISNYKYLISNEISNDNTCLHTDWRQIKNDFEDKICICIKESKHWLRMISKAVPRLIDEAKIYWKEANELNPVRYLCY